MLSDLIGRRRRAEREIRDYMTAADRYVDFGVILRTVVADEHGAMLLPGRPRLRVLREHHRGGLVDTKLPRPAFVGPSKSPAIWYVSEDQEQILLHWDEPGAVLGQLAYGSEGAGKTQVMAMFHVLQMLECVGQRREGGQTAPTDDRLEHIRRAMRAIYPPNWYHHFKAADLVVFADGTRVQLLSTYRQSQASGSRVQGYNWSWCARDEAQDQVDVHEDIVARLREAEGGRPRELASATAKDDTAWRTLRDRLISSGEWVKRVLLGMRSPFVAAAHWERMRRTMDPREYKRRVLAQDVGVELAVYYCWDRARNLVPRPRPTYDGRVVDVTAAILSQYRSYVRPAARFALLAGHDPGNIYNTTEVLRLVVIEDVPTWVVVGEYQTKQTTSRQHFRGFRQWVRETFHLEEEDDDSGKVLVFCDPHGKGESLTDYKTVHLAAKGEGIDVFSAAEGKIKRSARVAMINRLLVDAADVPRLVVATTAEGAPVAPVLVESFETLEKKPGDENAEGTQRKDETDRTHAPAAGGYALWLFEQEGLTEYTQRAALAAARKVAA